MVQAHCLVELYGCKPKVVEGVIQSTHLTFNVLTYETLEQGQEGHGQVH